MLFDKLIEATSTYMTPDQLDTLTLAYEFANSAHNGQRRKSGEPFINHPIEVARILADLRMDVDTLTAALLHDTVEDSSVTLEEVSDQFGPEVAELVDGVTKITRIEIESLTEAQANTLRKMLVAMSKDIRVIVIKLADRLHNMRTLMALREDRRIFKARETMEIYAPLAHRLGISSIKWELEDLSFFYLEPAKYQQVAKMVSESREAREAYLDNCIDILRDDLDDLKIDAQISGRPKHLYSIYQKMSQKGKDFSEIYDLIALRIIVGDVKDCYSSLGAVHTLWHPIPGRFKDYIAMPKFNMYQSLHTTVIGPAGRPLEIQIRTKEMHQMSEYGVAAHWRYKEGDSGDENFEKQLAWLRQMLDWQSDTDDPREFMESLKTDLFETEVFVFTPRGEVISLRNGATPIDFAYAIHTEVGHRCVGAKVNGSIVPLSYELQMGDRVEILTQKGSRPSRDWLNIVKTPRARSKIRAYFSKMSRGDDLLAGREILGQQMRKHGLGISSNASTKAINEVAEDLGFPTSDDLLVAIGGGKTSPKLVANRLLRILIKDTNVETDEPTGVEEEFIFGQKPTRSSHRDNDSGIIVKGFDDVLVRLSRCCNPVPGDEIVGFVTRGRGVSIHRADCPNAKALAQDADRMIDVAWASKSSSLFQVEILIEAVDRLRLLQDVTATLTDTGVNILSSTMQAHSDGMVEMRFKFELTETSRIDVILRGLNQIDGVFTARRMLAGESTGSKRHNITSAGRNYSKDSDELSVHQGNRDGHTDGASPSREG